MGRPPIAFSNSTANRSCPHHRHNLSPGGKVCRREGKHRHSAAPSPRRPFPRPTRPLDARAERRITSPQRAPAGVRPAQGAYRVRNSRAEGNVREVSEPEPPSAAEPLPPTPSPSTDLLHLPTRPKASVMSLPSTAWPLPPPPPPPPSCVSLGQLL